ncbi:MAG: response regulator transcription factor [Bacteroidia bacterium]|nr:response regulator transcription factor [Bacteroidia bacterium]NND51616.1 response regulator transcription factor [Flavobacteriaceae bacterium]
MKKTILIFSALIVALLVLFQLSKYSIISGDLNTEFVIAVIAIIFFFIGVYINKQSLQKNKELPYEIDHKKIESLEISKREYEVLKLMTSGLSNKEIANQLFLSESTIKSHASSLFVKLNAKRRTQAIQKAKALQII